MKSNELMELIHSGEIKDKLVRYIAIKEGKDYEQVCREFEI